MRLIGGILRLDGGLIGPDILTRMASQLPGFGQRKGLQIECDTDFGLFELTLGAAAPAMDPQPAGWLVAADHRPDTADPAPRRRFVELVQRRGRDFPDHVEGDCAVAVWSRNQRRLWLGRDFAGIRPLAWSHIPGRYFAFASAPRALHGCGLVSPAADPAAIALRHFLGYFPPGDSGLLAVRHLLAGQSLTIAPADEGPMLHQAWQPGPEMLGTWRHGGDAAAEELRTCLSNAVTRRLAAAGPAMCQLSGGLDSSAVVVLAARALRQRGERVIASGRVGQSRGSRQPGAGAMAIGQILAQESNIEWVSCEESPAILHFDPDLPDAAWESQLLPLQQLARAQSVAAVLTGLGGDQAASYNGTDVYAALFREFRWLHLARALRQMAHDNAVSLARATWRQLVRPMVPRGRLPGRRRAVSPRLLFLRPEYQAMADAYAEAERASPVPVRLRAFTRGKLADRCLSQSLLGLRDGIAYLHPLLDRQLVELSLSLPDHLLIGSGQTRLPFRQAVAGIVPEVVRLAPQKDPPPPPDRAYLAARKQATLNAMDEFCGDLRGDPVFHLGAIRKVLQAIPEEGEAAPGPARQAHFAIALRAGQLAVHRARLERLAAAAPERSPLDHGTGEPVRG